MLVFGIFSLVNLSMECSCMVPLTPAVMLMRGLVFRPLLCRVLINGSYFMCLCMRACSRNLSWKYVNLINWTMSVGEGDIGVCVWLGALIMHRMLGLSLASHLHGICWHEHLMSQSWIVCFGALLLSFHALVSVKNHVLLLAWSVWVMTCTTLLCRAILRPFRYGCSHVDRRWGHVFLSLLWHKVQLGFWCVRGQKMFFHVVTHILSIYEF